MLPNSKMSGEMDNGFTARGGRRIWPARGKRAAFSINPGHAPCYCTTNWAGIRGKMFQSGAKAPPLGPPLDTANTSILIAINSDIRASSRLIRYNYKLLVRTMLAIGPAALACIQEQYLVKCYAGCV